MDIDRILACPNTRRWGTIGTCGDRLNAQSVEDRAGFVGVFDFFHHVGDRARPAFLEDLLPIHLFRDHRKQHVMRYDWYPTHLLRQVKADRIHYTERKTISRNDVALSEIELVNRGAGPAVLAPTILAPDTDQADLFGITVRCVRRCSLTQPVTLAPGESVVFRAAAGVGLADEPTEQRVLDALRDGAVEAVIEDEKRFYQENVPEFHCSQPEVETVYYYRHYLLRRNLAHPNVGPLKYPVFYEGKQGGYSRLITASSALILDESRWWRDPRYGYGHMRNCIESLPEHGLFRDLWVNQVRGVDWPGYEEWISRSMADFLAVHPDETLLKQAAEAGYRNIHGLLHHKDKNRNLLLNPGGHHMTQEHSPAFTYFHNYRDWYDYTDIERIEYQAFFYGNLCGVARLMDHLGDPRAGELRDLAARVRHATLAAMWDPQDRFFYPVRESDGEKARCKEANGFLAFLFDLVPMQSPYLDIFTYLTDNYSFWNPWPLASCAKDVPVYSPHIRFWGDQEKSAGATWAGPTWPYFNSLLINVLSGVLRSGKPSAITPAILENFFVLFTELHLVEGIPMFQEHYDGITGEGFGCRDYLHCTYIDLVVRHVLGIDPLVGPEKQLAPMFTFDASISGLPFGKKCWNVEVDRRGNSRTTSAD